MATLAGALGGYAVALGHIPWGSVLIVLSVVLVRIADKLKPSTWRIIRPLIDIILSSCLVIFPADTYTTAGLIVLVGSKWKTN